MRYWTIVMMLQDPFTFPAGAQTRGGGGCSAVHMLFYRNFNGVGRFIYWPPPGVKAYGTSPFFWTQRSCFLGLKKLGLHVLNKGRSRNKQPFHKIFVSQNGKPGKKDLKLTRY